MQLGKGGPAPATLPPLETTSPAVTAPAEQAGILGSAEELAKMAAMAKHNGQQPAPDSAPQSAPVPPAPAPEPAPVAVANPAVPETIPVATPKEMPNVPTPPMPSPVAAPEKVAEKAPAVTEKIVEAPQAETTILDATPAPVKTDDAATRMPSAHDMMLKSTTPPDVTPAPAPTPSGNADTAALNMKMDTILSRLTTLEGEVTALKQKPDAGEQVADLKSSLESLEKKVSTQADTPAPARSARKAAAPVPAPAPVTPEEKPAPQILGAADSEPETNPVAGMPSPDVKKAAPRAVKVSTSWVLKGAQPGQATVAKPGESDSRTIHVGDTLPGIGRITAVEYQDGRWAVIGTQGRINQ
jgi:hypothetical protein